MISGTYIDVIVRSKCLKENLEEDIGSLKREQATPSLVLSEESQIIIWKRYSDFQNGGSIKIPEKID